MLGPETDCPSQLQPRNWLNSGRRWPSGLCAMPAASIQHRDGSAADGVILPSWMDCLQSLIHACHTPAASRKRRPTGQRFDQHVDSKRQAAGDGRHRDIHRDAGATRRHQRDAAQLHSPLRRSDDTAAASRPGRGSFISRAGRASTEATASPAYGPCTPASRNGHSLAGAAGLAGMLRATSRSAWDRRGVATVCHRSQSRITNSLDSGK
jgi:hypothetical protein